MFFNNNSKYRKDLSKIVGDKNFLFKKDQLEKYASDETPNEKPKYPDAVVFVESHEACVKIVKYCALNKINITPRSGGTGKTGGCVAQAGGIILSFEKFNQIVKIDDENLTATAQPGVILQDFKDEIARQNLYLPPDPASQTSCMLGGSVANNAGGPSALKYGSMRDYVIGLKIILPSGEDMFVGKKVSKGVAGYDLAALMCGSEGTLAVITEITFKLLPKPKAYSTALVYFGSSEQAAEAVSKILANGFLPSCLEYIDETCLNILGDPKGKAAIVIECDGSSEDQTLQEMSQIADVINSPHILIAKDEKDRRKVWAMRESLSEACKKHLGKKISEDITVPRNKIPEMIAKITSLGEKYELLTCAFGHAGDGNLHVQILFNDNSKLADVDRLLGELFCDTVKLDGTITGEHGVGVSKKKFLSLEQSENCLDLQRSIKNLFDPQGILNPGKFLPDK